MATGLHDLLQGGKDGGAGYGLGHAGWGFGYALPTLAPLSLPIIPWLFHPTGCRDEDMKAGWLTTILAPVSGDPVASSDLHRHQARTWCIDTYASKTFVHIVLMCA